jgi:hypothetical protein
MLDQFSLASVLILCSLQLLKALVVQVELSLHDNIERLSAARTLDQTVVSCSIARRIQTYKAYNERLVLVNPCTPCAEYNGVHVPSSLTVNG